MRNFGSIRTLINRGLSDAYLNENTEGKNIFKKYVKLLKEDTNLKNLFFLHKNLEDTTLSTEVAAKEFIKENIEFIKLTDEESLINSISKVGSLVSGEVDTNILHNAIHDLVFTERTLEGLPIIYEAMDTLAKHILTEKNRAKLNINAEYESVDSNKLIDIAVNKYNRRYADLSETEKNIVRLSLLDSDIKETAFNDMVSENLSNINDNLIERDETNVREKLKQTKEKLSSMSYNEDSFVDDMAKLSTLKDTVLSN